MATRRAYEVAKNQLRKSIVQPASGDSKALAIASNAVRTMVSNIPAAHKMGRSGNGLTVSALLVNWNIGNAGEKGTPISLGVILHQKMLHKLPKSVATVSENGNQMVLPVTFQRKGADGKKESAVTIGEIPIGGNVLQVNVWVPRSGKGSELKATLEENAGPGKLICLEKLTVEAYVKKDQTFPANGDPKQLPLSFKAKGFTIPPDEEQPFFNEPMGFHTILSVLASRRFIIPEPCYMNAPSFDKTDDSEENLTEDEKTKRKEANKKNQKDKVAKLLGQSFLGSSFSGSMLMKISDDCSMELENLRKYFGDSVEVKREQVPHAYTEWDEDGVKPLATSDFYSVNTAQDGSTTVSQMYHSAGAVYVRAQIGDEIFERCFCTKFTCFSEFKNSDKVFLSALVGSASPTGWMVAERHASKLEKVAITFPSSMDTMNTSYHPSSDGVTYTVCSTSNMVTTNLGEYVVKNAIRISRDGAIKRLQIQWPNAKNQKFSPCTFAMEQGRPVEYTLAIDSDTLKSKYPTGAPSHVVKSYAGNNMFNPRFSPFPGSCTNRDRSQPNQGVFNLSETPVIRLHFKQLEGLHFFSLSSAPFPEQFTEYLHSISHDEAIKITDELFSQNFDSQRLSPGALQAFELAGKNESLFSLKNHQEITYVCTPEDEEKLKQPLELLKPFMENLTDGPFIIGPGLPDQFKNPVRDIYFEMNGGAIPSKGDFDTYYSGIIEQYASEGNLSSAVPTKSLYDRIMSDVNPEDMISETEINAHRQQEKPSEPPTSSSTLADNPTEDDDTGDNSLISETIDHENGEKKEYLHPESSGASEGYPIDDEIDDIELEDLPSPPMVKPPKPLKTSGKRHKLPTGMIVPGGKKYKKNP